MDRDTFDLIFGVILSSIICLGVCGNVLSFVIWTKGRRCKKSPGGIFLRALDLADTFVLLLCATDKAMALLGTYRLRKVNTFFCKLHKTGWHFGLLVSTWIVVCFTLERMIVLGQPKRAAKWTSRGKTVGIIVFIFIASLLLNLPWAIGSDIMTEPDHIYITIADNSTNATYDGYKDSVEKVIVNDNISSLKLENMKNTSLVEYRKNENMVVGLDSDHMTLLENGAFFETARYTGFIEKITTKEQNIVISVVNITNTGQDLHGKSHVAYIVMTRSRQTDQSSSKARISFPNPKHFCGWGAFSFISQHEAVYHFWFIDFFLIFSIPFAIILSCNTAILIMVIWRRKKLQTNIRRGSLIQSVTARAVALSLVHCISTAPFSISILIPDFYDKAFITRTGHQYYIGIITVVCSYINNGVNFILYSFFGTDFRRDCADLLRRKSRVVPAERSYVSALRTMRKRSCFHLCHRDDEQHSDFKKSSGVVGLPSVSAKINFPSTSYETETWQSRIFSVLPKFPPWLNIQSRENGVDVL